MMDYFYYIPLAIILVDVSKRTNGLLNIFFLTECCHRLRKLEKHAEGLFVMEDWHNFGADYDKTLMAWHDNFNQLGDIVKRII